MLNYTQWMERAVEFTKQRRSLPGEVKVEIEVAPPLTDEEVNQLAKGCRLPIPESLRRFWTTASGHCHCTYWWDTPAQFRHQMAVVCSDWSFSHIWGGPEFELARDVVECCDSFLEASEARREEGHPRDARFYHDSVPLLPVGDGSYVGLYVADNRDDPPVVYLHYEGYGASHIIAPNLDEFLMRWEQLSYVGIHFLCSFINPRTELVEPDAFPVEREALRSLLRGEVRRDLVKPPFVLTESDWLSCADPNTMLNWLETSGKSGDRKLRLFACACCRRVWGQMGNWSRAAVQVSERFADALADEPELNAASTALLGGERGYEVLNNMDVCGGDIDPKAWEMLFANPGKAMEEAPWAEIVRRQSDASCESIDFSKSQGLMHGAAHSAVNPSSMVTRDITRHLDDPELHVEKKAQADLVRHIFGNPFRPEARPLISQARILELAARVYAGEVCEQELHAALKEARLDALAEHFLQAGHPKGCWALDLLLGK